MNAYEETAGAQTAAQSNVIDFGEALRAREVSAGTVGLLESIPPTLRHHPSSSTAARQTTRPESLEAELELMRTLRLVDDDIFEDGVENELSRAVPRLVGRFGPSAVEAVVRLYHRGVNPDTMCELLRWLGRVEHEASHDARFWFLVYCLRDDNPRVRSDAALGLASLEDSRAAEYLWCQARNEPIGLLRSRLEKLANELAI